MSAAWTAYDRGRLAGEIVFFLETLIADPSISVSYRAEARQLVAAAEQAWAKQ